MGKIESGIFRNGAVDAILFDMDGTLVDSERLHADAWNRTVERLGHTPPSPDWLDVFVGTPDSDTERGVIELFPDLADKGDILALKQEIFRELVNETGDSLRMPGILAPLRRLAAAGFPLAVVTNGVLANCRAVLGAAELLSFFRTLATFDQVERGKPAPDLYLAAARRLGAEPGRCVVVEDSSAGAAAGRAAGAFVVGVASSLPPQNLEAADIVLPDSALALEWIVDNLGGIRKGGLQCRPVR